MLPVAWPQFCGKTPSPRKMENPQSAFHNYQHLEVRPKTLGKTKPSGRKGKEKQKKMKGTKGKPKANCAQFGMTSPSSIFGATGVSFSQDKVSVAGRKQKVPFFLCLFNASTFARHLSLGGLYFRGVAAVSCLVSPRFFGECLSFGVLNAPRYGGIFPGSCSWLSSFCGCFWPY